MNKVEAVLMKRVWVKFKDTPVCKLPSWVVEAVVVGNKAAAKGGN